MASHPLDNPVWGALTGPQAELGVVHGRFRRYRDGIGVFAAVEDPADGIEGLAEAMQAGTIHGVVAPHGLVVPSGTELVEASPVPQMVAAVLRPADSSVPIRTLGVDDVSAMLELTGLTHPGPFLPRTIEMGHYAGIFDGERLVSMAGERMRLAGFTEISAVCTHPDYQGRGYAKALVSAIGRDIVERGETPFLHVRASNSTAIAAYERLGFAIRREMIFTVVRRP
jgi:predicted GNAT family acetyltransferase